MAGSDVWLSDCYCWSPFPKLCGVFCMKVFIDGKYYAERDAKVSVFDHGLLYGDGIFEGIRAYNGRVFKLEEHIDRLFCSAKALLLKIPMSRAAISRAVVDTFRVNRVRNGYVRLLVTRGPGTLGLNPHRCKRPSVIIIAGDIQLYPKSYYEKGLDIITVPTMRNLHSAVNPAIKSLNYLNNILAKIEAVQAGVDEAIMLNESGYVAEGSADNIWAVQDGTLCTPPTHVGILEGITRKVLQELCEENKIPWREKNMVVHDLIKAEEVFLCGTGAELIPVVEIDKRPIGDGRPGPVFRRMIELFRERAKTDGEPFR